MLSGLSNTALTMSRHEAVLSRVQWIGVGLRLILGVAAALALGATGLAISAALVTAGLSIAFWILTRRRLGLRTDPTLKPEFRLMFHTPA